MTKIPTLNPGLIEPVTNQEIYIIIHVKYIISIKQVIKKILKIVSKTYKQTLNKQNKIFQNEKLQKLRRLKNSNTKEYWTIINLDKKTETKCASLDYFYNFYQAAK